MLPRGPIGVRAPARAPPDAPEWGCCSLPQGSRHAAREAPLEPLHRRHPDLQRVREPAARWCRGCWRRIRASRCWSSTTTRPTAPASWPTTWRAASRASTCCTARGKEGLGPAYRAGFRRALELGADLVVQMDADFSHPPEMLPRCSRRSSTTTSCSARATCNGITVVNWPIERILLSYFGNLYVRKVTGLPISDTTGGFRCARRESARAHRPRAHPLQRLRLPDRDELPPDPPRRAHPRDPLLLPGPHARRLEADASASASRRCGSSGGCGSRTALGRL